jgi:hypothetical protein
MHFLKFPALLLPATAVCAWGQTPDPNTPKPSAKSPAEALVGVWHGKTAAGGEYTTFTADGRAVMQRGAAEGTTFQYKLDASAAPWKLDMSGKMRDVPVTIYTVFDFPSPDQFRMAPPAVDAGQRPDAKALAQSKVVLRRVTLGAHAGIFQVVEASLKKLAGTWEGKDGRETVTLTFSPDATWTMKVADFTDKGRFRIDVRQLPLAIDLLSTEGTGVKYSIFDFTTEGLVTGKAAKNPDERPAAFEDASARIFKRAAKGAQK